ncbi:MAG: MBOAT family protein [Magnetococcales bacterium]|nr:MBOAT family protein [Magnetococcales bacterium]MBF0263585.1 MBOAT family protein [Magnetococcales bacterium]
MLFTDRQFFLFFAVVFAIYWLLRVNWARKGLLLVASYGFYAAWDYRFLTLILLSTIVNHESAQRIHATSDRRSRLLWLLGVVTYNIGVLFYFKYLNFFIDSFVGFLGLFGVMSKPGAWEIILPVGISFYTFHGMSYPLDVYHRNLEPRRQWLDFAIFMSFFPQMLAGPIVRASEFLPQLAVIRSWKDVRVSLCLVWFVIGFTKKAAISDPIAIHVDRIFADPHAYATWDIMQGQILYAIQIYCDFSGYSDMALATAGLLGYTLPRNFNFPYLATNISEFWRRWHMSLSRWLHDYLYLPLYFLGENRSQMMIYRNLVITMLMCGLWHGAAWGFVVFGILHGGSLILHQEWQRFCRRHKLVIPFWRVIATVVTFVWVSWTLVYFRAPDVQVAWYLTVGTFFSQQPAQATLALNGPWIVAILAVVHGSFQRWQLDQWLARRGEITLAVLLGVWMAISTACMPTEYRPFIYFQF